ncbi:hypothetical protein SGRA_2840 [Saprospira grandis str. Lewin]|uniref:Uncharacterized protein n=1 Tax=Saprospira grandis (strain Lewin) TaxID=984262 RepID=H6LAH5_SAPGL|nr:hypothetical protein SGRA_2840 [Saprospira grandis str. Lewin]
MLPRASSFVERPSDGKQCGAAADPAGAARAGPSEQRAAGRSAAALLRRPQKKLLDQKIKLTIQWNY